MKTSFSILIIILWNISSSFTLKKSPHSPCNRWGNYGHCVPNRQCCLSGNWNYEYSDRGDCKQDELCCVYGSVLCQSCEEGTRKVNETCVDINECEEIYGICSGHKCINNLGGFTCECFDSYEMIGNLKTCKHMNQSQTADLLFSASRTINLMQLINKEKILSTKTIQMIYSGTASPKSIDYSFSGNYMAWTDITLHQINIAPINNKNPSLVPDRVILRYIKNPICLAIDWIHNLLYWTDLETRTINVANVLKPNDYYVVINVTNQEPHDLLVNVLDNVLIWNHVGLKPRIMRSFQDGTNQSVLYQTFKQTFCLTIDVFLKRYYFVDIEDLSLNSIDFEGKDDRKIFSSRNLMNGVNGMTIYYDEIFISTDNLIYKMNKFGHFDKHEGEKAEALVKSFGFSENKALFSQNATDSKRKQIFSAKIIDPILQPELENKCLFAKCSHLCLPSDKNQVFRCICPVNTILVNSTVCTERRFKALVMDSLSWESDLQTLINHSISKSVDLRKLLNQSFNEQIDLKNLFNDSFKETMELRKLFNFTSSQSIEMKKSFIDSLNETMFWKQVLKSIFNNRLELEKLLNQSIHSNDLTEVIKFINNLTKTSSKMDHFVHTSDQIMTETNSRTGEQVILTFILIGIFVIIIIFGFIGIKWKAMNFKKFSISSSHRNPLYRGSVDNNSIEEMESKI